MSDEKSLIPTDSTSSELATNLESLGKPLAAFVEWIGLPTEGVLAPAADRRKVVENLKSAIEILPMEKREKAAYLSRFTVAVSVGLFDGALNYLWNETVAALRRLVSRVDLSYFFSVATKINGRYSGLSSEEDLASISEHDLLEASRRIGLIGDVNYHRLGHVNYMRNHASAAHPNDASIKGFELLSWLESCLEHVIVAEPANSVIVIKRLMTSVRTEEIPSDDYPIIGAEIKRLTAAQIDDLVWTLFGMSCDANLGSQTRTNIEGIASYAWQAASEDRKFEIGARVGVFRKNGEAARKTLAETFLKHVDGLAYRDEDSLAGELLQRLEALKTAHFGVDNFYNEWPHAKSHDSSLPPAGRAPRAARPMWVKVLSICYVGNGHGYREGTDETAVKYYVKHIKLFGEEEVDEFLKLFSDAEFLGALPRGKPDERCRKLAKKLVKLTDNIHHKRALDRIIGFAHGKLHRVVHDSEYRKLLGAAGLGPMPVT